MTSREQTVFLEWEHFPLSHSYNKPDIEIIGNWPSSGLINEKKGKRKQVMLTVCKIIQAAIDIYLFSINSFN